MSTSTQSIREIVQAKPSAARIFERFEIDLCAQAEKSLDRACAELQLSVDQVLEKLACADAQEHGSSFVDPETLSMERLIQHIVRVHHQCVRHELPRLAEIAERLAGKRSDRAPELKKVAELTDKLRADMFAHIQKEENVLFPFIAQMDHKSIVAYPAAHTCFRSVSHPIFMMEQEHELANHIMSEIHSLTAGFTPPEWACATHTAFFAGLSEFEADLKQHVHLENDVLFPRAIEMEAELSSKR
jgi:regulator of cell morphogenesis and NO signaling